MLYSIIGFWYHESSKRLTANGKESNKLRLFLRIKEIEEQELDQLFIT